FDDRRLTGKVAGKLSLPRLLQATVDCRDAQGARRSPIRREDGLSDAPRVRNDQTRGQREATRPCHCHVLANLFRRAQRVLFRKTSLVLPENGFNFLVRERSQDRQRASPSAEWMLEPRLKSVCAYRVAAFLTIEANRERAASHREKAGIL